MVKKAYEQIYGWTCERVPEVGFVGYMAVVPNADGSLRFLVRKHGVWLNAQDLDLPRREAVELARAMLVQLGADAERVDHAIRSI